MQRREFITLLAVRRVAGGSARAATWKFADHRIPGGGHACGRDSWLAAFVKRLGELGWIEGSTIAIEYRWAEVAASVMPRSRPNSSGSRSMSSSRASAPVLAAKQATQVIPVVFAAQTDPVGAGVV